MGLDEIIANRIGKKLMGFGKESGDEEDEQKALGKILERVEPDDLLKFGMIPELIGRLPVFCALWPLTEDDLIRIMLEPRNSIIRQYHKFFELEGRTLEFTDEALRLIAKKSLERETGARAIRSILENVKLDIMFKMPSRKDVLRYEITPEIVKGEKSVFAAQPPARKKKKKKRDIA